MIPEFLSLKEVAKRLNALVKTVDRRIKSGKLRAFKEGGRWYVLVTDLEDYIASLIEGVKVR